MTERFIIITACNPHSGDDKAHEALRKALSRLDCWEVEGSPERALQIW